jgi:hypothetical protein
MTDSQREGCGDSVIAIVQVALVDDKANIHFAAAQAFDMLQEPISVEVVDRLHPTPELANHHYHDDYKLS